MDKTVKEQLLELADEKYRAFHSALVPGVDNVLGVRLPEQRKIAREIARKDFRNYLNENLHKEKEEYYEETLILGLVIGYAKGSIDEILSYVALFLPKINNWGICDSFCSSLKITNKNLSRVWNFLQPYLTSTHEFELRFGIVMLLQYYILEEYIDRVLEALDAAKHEGYYVKMAVAWAVSICFVKFPEKTMEYLKNNSLDDFTYNKSLQKIIESLRVDKETKDLIRSMKRK